MTYRYECPECHERYVVSIPGEYHCGACRGHPIDLPDVVLDYVGPGSPHGADFDDEWEAERRLPT